MCTLGRGSNVELMSPANPGAPLNASLQKFVNHRGEGLFALMLEAPDTLEFGSASAFGATIRLEQRPAAG